MLFVAFLFAVLGAGCAYLSWDSFRTVGFIRDTPTTPAAKIQSAGYFEAEGNVAASGAVRAPLDQRDCVYYRTWLETEVEWTETRSDGSETRRRKTRKSDELSYQAPFLLQDRSGTIRVDPQGSSLTCHRKDSAAPTESLLESFSRRMLHNERVLRRRVIQEAIYVGDHLYVLGWVRQDPDGVQFCRRSGDKEKRPYLVSVHTEAETEGTALTSVYLWGGASALGFLVALGIGLKEML